MKEWEEVLRHKIYVSKIKAAKSIVSKVSHERSSQKSVNPNSSRQPQPEDQQAKQQGMTAALRRHGLQQYERELSERGFLESPERLQSLMKSDRLTTLESEIKILPGHRTRLTNMLKALDNETTRTKLPLLRPIVISRVEASSQATIAKNILDVSQPKQQRRQQKIFIGGESPLELHDRHRNIAKSLNLASSSSKNLRPAIKKAMVRLVAARKKGPFEIEINYKDHELSFRSIEGAKMASSLGSPDLSELVECYANYLLSSMAKPNSKERKRPINIIDDDMFSKVKQRSNSFTQLIKDTVDTETSFSIFDDFSEKYPSLSSVSNYLRNVLTSCKFQLESLPVSAHYIHTLKAKKVLVLTNSNFRRVTLTAMLLAHKVQDDRSLRERVGCSQFVKPATLFEMERTLLQALNYHMYPTAEEYSSSYFRLRSYVRKEAVTHRNIETQRCHIVQYVPLRQMIGRDRLQALPVFRQRPKSF